MVAGTMLACESTLFVLSSFLYFIQSHMAYLQTIRIESMYAPKEEESSFGRFMEKAIKPIIAIATVLLFFILVVISILVSAPASPPPPAMPAPPNGPPPPIQPILFSANHDCSTYLTELECRTWANNEGRTAFASVESTAIPKGCTFAPSLPISAFFNSHPDPPSTCTSSVHECVCGRPVYTPK